jgi:hypothetical protein
MEKQIPQLFKGTSVLKTNEVTSLENIKRVNNHGVCQPNKV